MTAHTPGPWRVHPGGLAHVCVPTECGGCTVIADVCGRTRDNPDAAYIALACNSFEDLVGALQRIRAWLVCPATDRDTLDEMQALAASAIAKARGERT